MDHYQNNIQILKDLGFVIVLDEQQQPHSKVVQFDCGCIVCSEFILNPQVIVQMPSYRQWHIPCSLHNNIREERDIGILHIRYSKE